jgi:hypothetical protein
MSALRELPNRRRHDVRDFTFRGLQYSIGVGYFRDGGLAELFQLQQAGLSGRRNRARRGNYRLDCPTARREPSHPRSLGYAR